jgi:hypothetical protein
MAAATAAVATTGAEDSRRLMACFWELADLNENTRVTAAAQLLTLLEERCLPCPARNPVPARLHTRPVPLQPSGPSKRRRAACAR